MVGVGFNELHGEVTRMGPRQTVLEVGGRFNWWRRRRDHDGAGYEG